MRHTDWESHKERCLVLIGQLFPWNRNMFDRWGRLQLIVATIFGQYSHNLYSNVRSSHELGLHMMYGRMDMIKNQIVFNYMVKHYSTTLIWYAYHGLGGILGEYWLVEWTVWFKSMVWVKYGKKGCTQQARVW